MAQAKRTLSLAQLLSLPFLSGLKTILGQHPVTTLIRQEKIHTYETPHGAMIGLKNPQST